MSNLEGKSSKIVDKMYAGDFFSQWLGIEVIEIGAGYSKIVMTTREEMSNGFQVIHGGISYSLADSALAFASNSHGRHAVSIHTEINHTRPIFPGDKLTAIAHENHCGKNSGLYTIEIKNQNEKLVAHFRGTVFRKNTEWAIED